MQFPEFHWARLRDPATGEVIEISKRGGLNMVFVDRYFRSVWITNFIDVIPEVDRTDAHSNPSEPEMFLVCSADIEAKLDPDCEFGYRSVIKRGGRMTRAYWVSYRKLVEHLPDNRASGKMLEEFARLMESPP